MVAKVKVSAVDGRGKTNNSRLPKAIQFLPSHKKKSRSNEVAPLGLLPLSRNAIDSFLVSTTKKSFGRENSGSCQALSFYEAFGVLGVPILLIVLGCIIWTFWLIALSLAPNATANFLMDTSEFDGGQFWLIPDEWGLLQFFSTAGLTLVLAFYVYVLLKMLAWRSQPNILQDKFAAILIRWEISAKMKTDGSLRQVIFQRALGMTWKIYVHWKDFTGIHGKNRKFWNILLKLHDLVMLSLMLRDQLEAGTPVQITNGFAVMAALNSLSCAVGILVPRFTALVEILVDCLFDFTATVIYPLVVLHYCVENFHYDRAVFFISMELLPIGSFERRARMYANPAEIALVRASFDSLRILDATDLFLRIGMNLAFSYRFKRIVEVLIQIKMTQLQSHDRRKTSLKPTPVQLSFSRSSSNGIVLQRDVPKPIAALFVAFSASVLVLTYGAISTSQSALVDGNPAPRTYYEWTHPIDATDSVKALAASGTLETLQLINRQLTILPKELRGCRNLNFISLINCATKELPVWAKEFRNLQYLQVEGKEGSDNLGDLEPDIFSDMPKLRYLQLGVQSQILHFPSLEGAPNLRSIIFSRMYNLVYIPPLTRQTRLERLELTADKMLPAVPDLQPVVSLVHFALFQGAYLCCNGFRGDCDLTNPFCKSATCLDDDSPRATQTTLQAFKKFEYAVCQPSNTLSQVPTPETIQMCDGVPYRQCFVHGLEPNASVVGMCYNHRMQVLACNPDPNKIRVRRRQIQDHVGVPCDPVVEAWLGCSNETS